MAEGQTWPIKFHFGPIKNENGDGNGDIFSEIEKEIPSSPEMAKKITVAPQEQIEKEGESADYGSEEAAAERCSELWNEIKDAMVLEGMELTDSLLAQLQMRATILAQQINELSPQTGSIQNVHLRFGAVLAALGELKKKKENAIDDEWQYGKGEAFDVPISRSACIGQFRKWLQQQEAEMGRIRQRIPGSKNCSASLRELELEQKTQQEQIQTEGRAKHQQLCSFLGSDGQGHHQNWADKEDNSSRLCEPLEQRYLALWLASLESLELISHFKERLRKNCPEESFIGSELEEGPDPKRRKTLAIEENIMSKMSSEFPQQSNLALPKLEASKLAISEEKQPKQQMLIIGSDIGYSSGENNSVHEDGNGTTTNTNSLEENVHSKEAANSNSGPHWAEQIALSSELEKSFYRTVPLDEFGCTDLDTDEGGGNYLAQKFMMDELMEKGMNREGGGGGKLELTDSLIVHVDAPENRQLNDFEEIMDILDHPESNDQHQIGRRSPYYFSEDDCESHSSMENARIRHLASRKRALAKITTPMANSTNLKSTTTDLANSSRRRRPQQQNGRRKWAQVRKSRSSNDGCWNAGATAGMWSSSNYLSSDFEWDEDFGGISSGMRGMNRKMYAELPEYDNGDEDDEKEPTMLMARKKALCAFRDGLRQAVAESGNVNVRLRELLALVDKSMGGVDSAAYLLAEIQSTFTALSGFCQSLESRMGRIWMEKNDRKEEKENTGMAIRIGHIKDIESELMLCHERMNALETTCNNLALLLGKHLSDGQCPGNASTSTDSDYLAQFAGECNRIREELAKLKNRFGEKFVFATIQLPNDIPNKQQQESPSVDSDAHKKIINITLSKSTISPCTAINANANREHSFWRSYLLLCLLGFITSLGTLLYANSQESTDWRWSFGPQLHYENGPPPI